MPARSSASKGQPSSTKGRRWADSYRDKWKWDKVTWGSHSVDCYPGGCSWRVYTRDGKSERGEGKWKRVSWDEALTDIADAMLDAIEADGPESIVNLFTPEVGATPARIWAGFLGAATTDGNSEFQDFSPGFHTTWGKFNPASALA